MPVIGGLVAVLSGLVEVVRVGDGDEHESGEGEGAGQDALNIYAQAQVTCLLKRMKIHKRRNTFDRFGRTQLLFTNN